MASDVGRGNDRMRDDWGLFWFTFGSSAKCKPIISYTVIKGKKVNQPDLNLFTMWIK